MDLKYTASNNGGYVHHKNADPEVPLDNVAFSSKSNHRQPATTGTSSAMLLNDSQVHSQKQSFCRERKLSIILACFCLILICLLAIFVTLYFYAKLGSSTNSMTSSTGAPAGNETDPWNKTEQSVKHSTCTTKGCVQIASLIIEAMDDTVDPCDDFYQFSCGGWLKKTQIPDSRTRYSRFEQLSEQNSIILKKILDDLKNKPRNASTPILDSATIYYYTCMDTKKIELLGDGPMKEMVQRLGSWPVTDASFNASNWDMMTALVDVHKNISQSPVFNIYVAGDIKNSTENILVFDQSNTMLNRESYMQNSTFHRKHRDAYRTMMKAVATLMGANESTLVYMDKVYEFEKELAKITMSVMERRDYRLIYERMTLEELANKTEIPLEWLTTFVNRLFKETGKTVPITEEIVSFNTKYIKTAYKLFMALSPEVQSSYVVWNAVKIMAPVVLGKYQDIMDEYFMAAFGVKEQQPRYEICVGSTLGALGYVLSIPFVEEVYDKAAKTMSTEMIQAIKHVFEKNLDHMDWMDNKTRQYAKLKASKILENIGYPEFIMNNTALDLEYRGFVVRDGQHFNNFMERRKHKNLKNYQKRGKPVDKSAWGVLPTTVNAYYAPTENKIGFPAGILQWPFYDKRAPRAVAYGAIGMVVGHEITHGFDDQGKDFTIEGNLDTWWTNHSTEGFANRSQCFIDQYSNFTLFNKKMKGQQTLGEDLADSGGLRQSLQAYRNWVAVNGEEEKLPGLDLTPDQLYFMAFGQVWCTAYRESAAIHQIENGVHSLSMFRVIGTLQNSEEFSKAYKCPVGSNMNPKNKCQIW